jgi:hypothetical protein
MHTVANIPLPQAIENALFYLHGLEQYKKTCAKVEQRLIQEEIDRVENWLHTSSN